MDDIGTIYCSAPTGKFRVNSIKYILIRRLKLTATTLSIKISKLIKTKLDIEDYE